MDALHELLLKVQCFLMKRPALGTPQAQPPRAAVPRWLSQLGWKKDPGALVVHVPQPLKSIARYEVSQP